MVVTNTGLSEKDLREATAVDFRARTWNPGPDFPEAKDHGQSDGSQRLVHSRDFALISMLLTDRRQLDDDATISTIDVPGSVYIPRHHFYQGLSTRKASLQQRSRHNSKAREIDSVAGSRHGSSAIPDFSSLIGCWAVLLPLAWALQSYWGPIAYAVGITGLEGIFCLGLIWNMNPANMPRAFCITQVLVSASATFFLVGVLVVMTTATTIYVAKPKQWDAQNATAILQWRFYYLLPLVLFPLLASIVHVIFVVFFDTFEASDGLNCIARPLWIRFLGYAGTPFLLTIPCLWLTLLSAIRVVRTHQHIRRARRSVNFDNIDHFTTIPQRKSHQSLTTGTPPTPRAITVPSPSSSYILRMASEARRQPISSVLRDEKIRNFHLPFPPASPEYITASSGHRSQRSEDSSDTNSSVSFAEMKSKSPRPLGNLNDTEEEDITTPLRSFNGSLNNTTRNTRVSSSIHNSDRISITQLAFSLRNGEDLREDSDYFHYYSGETSWVSVPPIHSLTPLPRYRKTSELSSLVLSFIIFQFAIISIHLLSAITPLIDIVSAKSRPPTELGTQHIALLLAGWAPVVIFCPLSAVRSQLIFWR
ncbi:hypothetical protein DFH07DRAFT_935052 [Mycena maculata]|uniref:Uncharacterized protein n=1 Tax=Mycena maculata TaxID=230809 RepID=A0AAD7KGT5_9AGAR|nr:hypothetical protein DFH07DRAFT_935052 [Mycena maculata]